MIIYYMNTFSRDPYIYSELYYVGAHMKLDICNFPDKGKKLQLFTTKIHDKANNSVIKFNAASSNGYFFRTQICKLNHKYVRIMFALLLTF